MTQAALRAGVPQVVTPSPTGKRAREFRHDSEWVEHLGCGKVAMALEETTAEILEDRLRTVLSDASVKAKAAEVAKTLQKEQGILGAVALVSNFLQPTGPRDLPPAQVAPWADGRYKLRLIDGTQMFENDIVGMGAFHVDGGRQIGCFRLGSYRSEKKAGLPPGHASYTIMAIWLENTHVGYGIVSQDRKRITWDDGCFHEFVAEVPKREAKEKKKEQEQDGEGEAFSPFKFLGGLVDQLTQVDSLVQAETNGKHGK